jgi:C1A family cysteine protease
MNLNTIRIIAIQLISLTLLMVKPGFAEDVAVIGTFEYSIKLPNANFTSQHKPQKIIQLLKMQLSEEEKNRLVARAKEVIEYNRTSPKPFNADYLSQVQLGMNNVPVLDQGRHGTCVTFATTAALDAIVGKGDYISQLCNLQLGNYLEQYKDGLSGWEGSYVNNVIAQIEQYGIVNKEKQQTVGCGGLTQYPTNSSIHPASYIKPEEFKAMSEPVFNKVATWANIYWTIWPYWTLDEVKKALNSGDRVVFGTLLPRIDRGIVGAVGKYKGENDTWVLANITTRDIKKADAGHEMIITGYDDNAIAVDSSGKQHKGLLSLRNSWGNKIGDEGNFYMSYDYFVTLTIEARKLSSMK